MAYVHVLLLSVRQGARVPLLTLAVDRHAVPVAGLDVAVDGVVRRVEAPVAEPAGAWGVGPVEDLGEVPRPGEQLACLVGPEAEAVGSGPLVEIGRAHV